LLARERTARLIVPVGDLHAARVVYQDAEEVLLRHRRLDDEHRAEQADEHEQQRGGADGREHEPVHRSALRARRTVRQYGRHDRDEHDPHRHVRTGGRHEPKLSLLEDHRSVAEEQLEERIEQRRSPVVNRAPSADCITGGPALGMLMRIRRRGRPISFTPTGPDRHVTNSGSSRSGRRKAP
jgi:hypothetical protein